MNGSHMRKHAEVSFYMWLRYAVASQITRIATLAGMQIMPHFTSDMSDPLDARDTHLISLIMGGKNEAEPLSVKRQWEKAQRRATERRVQLSTCRRK